MTTPQTTRASAAAKELFTDGRKLHADRLVMEFRGGKIDGTGWCEGAVRDIIAKHFEGDALRTAAERALEFFEQDKESRVKLAKELGSFDPGLDDSTAFINENAEIIEALRAALKTKE